MDVQRLAAFSEGHRGGNPAGVVLCETLPPPETMQAVAAEVGYSETVFAAPERDGWRVRYFAPEMEVPFCGHATIALGAALAAAHGDGVYPIRLNEGAITVEGWHDGSTVTAALQSPRTSSAPATADLVGAALTLFALGAADLDLRIPPAIAQAGARHLVLALGSRRRLAEMRYDLAEGRRLMLDAGIVTICLVHAETPSLFHTRNPFAAGGVYEDPATGAATAALSGYLRDLDWPHGGRIEILQGVDMGVPSRLWAEIGPGRGDSIRVSGRTRPL